LWLLPEAAATAAEVNVFFFEDDADADDDAAGFAMAPLLDAASAGGELAADQ
jgi:hypothetical protein